jgi:aerobic carbon-monoxide dehydrogenase medium subunit
VFNALGQVQPAATVAEAVAALTDLGDEGAAIAGGTWVMRAPPRAETRASTKVSRRYVALKHIPELSGCTVTTEAIALGSLLTHAGLAAIQAGPAYACVRDAARKSAFPQVRNVATVGGNISAIGFAEADLVPALLAAEARVELSGPAGSTTMLLADYLPERARRPHGELIARVHIPTPARRSSAFERLTVRAQGEYPIVNVAVSVDVAGDVITGARVAVGSIEPAARLCATAAAQLVGHPVGDPVATKAAGEAAAAELTARDGLDAPGWYRLAVLPAVIQRAIARVPATL